MLDIISMITLFLSIIFILVGLSVILLLIGGNRDKTEEEQKFEDDEQMRYIAEYKNKKNKKGKHSK